MPLQSSSIDDGMFKFQNERQFAHIDSNLFKETVVDSKITMAKIQTNTNYRSVNEIIDNHAENAFVANKLIYRQKNCFERPVKR